MALSFNSKHRQRNRAAPRTWMNRPYGCCNPVCCDGAQQLYGRLLHHRHIVNIRGNSYRMRHHRELWQSLLLVLQMAPSCWFVRNPQW